MAEVELDIAGRRHVVGCRDGEEEHLRALAREVSRKTVEVQKLVGSGNETRQLLLAALLIADELNDVRTAAAAARVETAYAPPPPAAEPADPGLAIAIERLADRMEAIAVRLEG